MCVVRLQALGGDTATKGGSQVMAGNPPETEGQGNEVGVSNDLASPSGNDSALPSARGVDAVSGDIGSLLPGYHRERSAFPLYDLSPIGSSILRGLVVRANVPPDQVIRCYQFGIV